MRRVRVVLPPVWPAVFGHVADLFAAAIEELGLAAEIAEVELAPDAALNVVLGWSVFAPENPGAARYVVYQLEPLRLDPWHERLAASGDLFGGALAVWDYSETNLEALAAYPHRLVPLRFHERLRPPPESRRRRPSWDVLFVGAATERRRRVLEELSRHCCVTARLRWDDDLEQALDRTKLLLNVHQTDDPTPLEQPRVAYALNRDCLVVSEESLDRPYDALPMLPYADLVEGTLALLRDPPARERAREAACAAFAAPPRMADVVREALAEVGVV